MGTSVSIIIGARVAVMTTDKRGASAVLVGAAPRPVLLRDRLDDASQAPPAMVNVARERLHGELEVDETWVDGEQAGLRGSRQLEGRRAALVLVAVEKRGRGSGRILETSRNG